MLRIESAQPDTPEAIVLMGMYARGNRLAPLGPLRLHYAWSPVNSLADVQKGLDFETKGEETR